MILAESNSIDGVALWLFQQCRKGGNMSLVCSSRINCTAKETTFKIHGYTLMSLKQITLAFKNFIFKKFC